MLSLVMSFFFNRMTNFMVFEFGLKCQFGSEEYSFKGYFLVPLSLSDSFKNNKDSQRTKWIINETYNEARHLKPQ